MFRHLPASYATAGVMLLLPLAATPRAHADEAHPISVWEYSLYKTITYETVANLADIPLYNTMMTGAVARTWLVHGGERRHSGDGLLCPRTGLEFLRSLREGIRIRRRPGSGSRSCSCTAWSARHGIWCSSMRSPEALPQRSALPSLTMPPTSSCISATNMRGTRMVHRPPSPVTPPPNLPPVLIEGANRQSWQRHLIGEQDARRDRPRGLEAERCGCR